MSHDDREEPTAHNGNGNGHGEDHTGETLIRRLAREEVSSLALSRIANVESSIAAFRDVSLDRYKTLTGELVEVRTAVLSLQGDAAVTRKNTEKIVTLLECLETRVMLAFSEMGTKTGDMRGRLDSVHDDVESVTAEVSKTVTTVTTLKLTDAEHDAKLAELAGTNEVLAAENKTTRLMATLKVGVLAGVAIAAWEIAKWAAPLIDKLTH